jgi:2-polyprenyl-3-methyl-5-hydroxy-6-metoxy-1,4-benzoquinol methylase
MNLPPFSENGRRPRLLVVIASFGERNLSFLNQIIHRYRNLDLSVEIVVLSEAPKKLESEEKVVVGLPTKNPWSLPFAHKKIFAENAERFDLFAYSEDDIEVTEKNIEAFLRVSPFLEDDEIFGFLRYEVDKTGTIHLPDCHAHYHWRVESVRRRGPYKIAEYTNEHAAFYLLTQTQLKKAIASGGFLRGPYQDRYDMLCTAATDPYTSCGFRKVICITPLEDCLIHHMSNRYAGKLGVPLSTIKEQVQALERICDDSHPPSTLCQMETKVLHRAWSKSYYEEPSSEILGMIPTDAHTILSIGCGWGATEAELKRRGATVTAFPLDSLIGVSAARLGLEVICGSMNQCFDSLGSRKFDCVLLTDLLHLQCDPQPLLERSANFVRDGGTLVIGGPNFHSASIFVKRALRKENYGRLQDFSASGIRIYSPRRLTSQISKVGFWVDAVRWHDHMTNPSFLRKMLPRLGSISARRWIVRACRFS